MADARGSTYLLCGLTHVRREEAPDDAIAALATRQLGIAGRGQLLDLRIGARSIDHRLGAGRLRRRFPGVYAVGHEALPYPARVLAAVMSVLPEAAASHWATAALLDLCDPMGPIHVTATQHRAPRAGVSIHRGALPAEDLAIVSGIPATTVERTLLDLSAVASPATLRRLVKRAEFLDLTDAKALGHILARHPRRRGRGRLARLVDGYMLGVGKTRSEFEDRFLRFCARRGLPLPETNVVIDVRGQPEVDCVWRTARLIVELDSRSAHGREAAFHEDRARDRALIAARWAPMRVTWAQLHQDGDSVEADIRQTLGTPRGDARRLGHAEGG